MDNMVHSTQHTAHSTQHTAHSTQHTAHSTNSLKDLDNLKLLSVIIPAYNVEKFLIKCVDSVANQTYKNIEIIIVDDGSTDSTPQLCEELKAKYNNRKFKIVTLNPNQGINWARRAGFNAASGDYVATIDADDYIDLNAYAKAIKVLEENNLDMVQFGACFVNDEGAVFDPPRKPVQVQCDNPHDALKYFFAGLIYISQPLWCKVYKRSLFENLEWPKVSLHEDACTSVQVFAKVQKFMTIEDKFYYYLQRGNSVSHKSYLNPERRGELITASDFVTNFIEKNCPDLLPEALFHPTFGFFDVIFDYIKSDLPESKEIIKQFVNLIRDKYFRMRRELKRQKRKLDMGYDLKFSRKKLLAMKLFAYCPSLIVFALKIYFKRHGLGGIKK